MEPLEGRLPLLALFLSFDIPFLLANLFKFLDGGYVPMLIGAALIAGMLIWSRGRTALMESYARRFPTFDEARPILDRCFAARPGTAVFLSLEPPTTFRRSWCTMWSGAARLHENVILLTVKHSMSRRPRSVAVAAHGVGGRILPAHRFVRLHGGTLPYRRARRRHAP